ncbi:MAG: hypothetical protein AAF231_04620 [Pseudomonadota bacterium]
MTDFGFIEGKVQNPKPYTRHAFWEMLPSIPRVQSFYEAYSHAEGFIGEDYLVIWHEDEVAAVWQEDQMGTSKDFLFFGGNGGGEGFGCHWVEGKETYFSAQFVCDLHSDRTDLGNWTGFRKAILEGSYL